MHCLKLAPIRNRITTQLEYLPLSHTTYTCNPEEESLKNYPWFDLSFFIFQIDLYNLYGGTDIL